MFVKEDEPLGNGAYGVVHKVRSLHSTKLGNSGNERVMMTKKSLKRANEMHAAAKRNV